MIQSPGLTRILPSRVSIVGLSGNSNPNATECPSAIALRSSKLSRPSQRTASITTGFLRNFGIAFHLLAVLRDVPDVVAAPAVGAAVHVHAVEVEFADDRLG